MDKKQRVLIVDDEPRNQRIVVETLEDLVEFKVCSSGEEALAAMGEYDPDVVLLDIMMPGTDGYEVCRRLKASPEHSFCKVILVSGKAMLEERLKGYDCGADDYMTKPFVPEELLAKVKVFLKLTGLEKQLTLMNRSLEEQVKERTGQLMDSEARRISSAKMAALGEMAGGIAHEINTPLATIGLIGDQIKEIFGEEKVDREAVFEMLGLIEKTVGRIGAIINGLRTFSRDGGNDRFENLPLRQIIDETTILCQEKIKHGNVKFGVQLTPEDLTVRCRPVQLSQVILNLVGNAVDAIGTSPDKWVRIEAKKSGDKTEIFVTDSGKGIPESVREKIFHPFFTTKDVGKGTGLGLSISKGIIEAHGGSMSIDARCENTRFVIELPDTAASDASPAKKAV